MDEKKVLANCAKECEVYSRIVGYFRPVQNWNVGKREEFNQRVEFLEDKGIRHGNIALNNDEVEARADQC